MSTIRTGWRLSLLLDTSGSATPSWSTRKGAIGLCATAGARLTGVSLAIGVDSNPTRPAMATTMGADVVIDCTQEAGVLKVAITT